VQTQAIVATRPRAAERAILLEHDDRDAEALEGRGRGEAGRPSADHDDW
jgi:hypothetical protein